LRRLFSTFARGWPGAGLLLLRLVASIVLIAKALPSLATLNAVAIVAGLLLLAGLWTPVAGSAAAVLGIWNTLVQNGDPWANILLATIGAALAMLGPGAWSVDSRLFGWKRIDVRNRAS
jgi:putative oxidoreductase